MIAGWCEPEEKCSLDVPDAMLMRLSGHVSTYPLPMT